MKYISIDGDDIGRKISSFYLRNDVNKLKQISNDLELSTRKISDLLVSNGFVILFRAADGVVASIDKMEISFDELFASINKLAPNGISFSAGVGDSLRDAYIALLAAKSNGKNRLYFYSDVISEISGKGD